MTTLLRRSALAALAMLLAGASSASAVPRVYKQQLVEPPSASAITAVADGVFVTAAGEAFADRNFRFRPAAGIAAGVVFTDVARNGANVVAVGKGGSIWRSTDAGASFAQVTGTTTFTNSCLHGGANPSGPLTVDLFSVKFADPGTVYVTGENATVLKSTTAGQVFSEVNKRANGTCLMTSGGPPYDAIADSAWLNATTGYLISRNFGRIFVTTDGLASATPRGNATNVADTGGASGQPVRDRPQLAVDPANPARAWAVNIGPGGSFFVRSTDGGATWTTVTADGKNAGLHDVGYASGTVVAVGDAGEVYRSLDGAKFDREDDSQRPAVAFRGVSVTGGGNVPGFGFSGPTVVIGGDGGALLAPEDAPSAVTPKLTFTPASPCTGSGITFDASGSSSTAGSVVKYEWDLDGNGSFETTTGTRATAGSVYDYTRYDPPLPGYRLGKGERLTGRAPPSFVWPSFGSPEFPIPVREPVHVRVRVTDQKGNAAVKERTVTFLDGHFVEVFGGGVVDRTEHAYKCPLRKTSRLRPATVVSSHSVMLSSSGSITVTLRCPLTRVCLDRIALHTDRGSSLFRTEQVGLPPGPPIRVAIGLTKAGQALVARRGAVRARLTVQDARTRGRGPERAVKLRIRG